MEEVNLPRYKVLSVFLCKQVLALYLTLHPQLVVGGSILEVGAGVGLAGLVAAKLLTHPRRAVLTDNQEEVLTVLRKNTDRNFTHLKQEGRKARAKPTTLIHVLINNAT